MYNPYSYHCENLFPLGIVPPSGTSLAAYCLLLPGKQLHLSALLAAKKFRGRGNKEAAVAALQELEEAGLGKVEVEESRRGTAAVGFLTYNMHAHFQKSREKCTVHQKIFLVNIFLGFQIPPKLYARKLIYNKKYLSNFFTAWNVDSFLR